MKTKKNQKKIKSNKTRRLRLKGAKKRHNFKDGDRVFYKKNNEIFPAVILKIHFDDIEPYYTIMMNGSEKQTTIDKLEF